MKIDLKVLHEALNKLHYTVNGYASEELVDLEVTMHDENMDSGKLGDILVMKMTTISNSSYSKGKEITRIVEVPAKSENVGQTFRIVTQTVENFDLAKKETS